MGKLERVIEARDEYKRLKNKVEELESITEKVTTSFSKVPKAKGNHLKDDDYAKLIDLKNKYDFQLRAYIHSYMELDEELDCIRDTHVRTVMKMRYLDGLTVEQIGEYMNYSARNIYYATKKGRSIYYKTFPERH